jgi:heme-degrading monooxygenase HmoA
MFIRKIQTELRTLRQDGVMITEHAILPITAGREEEFERAFGVAKNIIATSPGFLDVSLLRGIESPSSYLLLVHWESVEAHVSGFRGTPTYDAFRSLLHEFYDSVPVVEHFVEVASI